MASFILFILRSPIASRPFPRILGDIGIIILSTRFTLSRAVIIPEPPSTSTDIISLLPSSFKRLEKLTLPFLSFFTTNTSAPNFLIAVIFLEGALDVVAIIVWCGLSSVRTDDLMGIRSLLSTIMRKGFFP